MGSAHSSALKLLLAFIVGFSTCFYSLEASSTNTDINQNLPTALVVRTDDSHGTTEVDTFQSDSPEETQKIEEFLKNDLQKNETADPNLKASVVLVEPPENKSESSPNNLKTDAEYEKIPNAIAPKEAEQITRRPALPDYWPQEPDTAASKNAAAARPPQQSFLKKYHKITFTLVRTIAAAGAATWGVIIAQHMPLELALCVGFVVAAMTVPQQYLAKQYGEFIKNAIKTHPAWMGMLTTEAGLEIGFTAIILLTEKLLGFPPDSTLIATTKNLLWTSGVSTASDGLWETSAAENTVADEDAHFKLAAKFAIGAIIDVISDVALLNHMGIAYVGYGLLTTGGLLTYAQKYHVGEKVKNWSKSTYQKISCTILGRL